VGPRAGLDAMGKRKVVLLTGIELWPPIFMLGIWAQIVHKFMGEQTVTIKVRLQYILIMY
jgi:hypothetical protein